MTFIYDVSGILGFNYRTNFSYDENGELSYDEKYYFYRKNLQGDVIAVYDEQGTKCAEYKYDAWGYCTAVCDVDNISLINPIRYRSYYYDTETDLYYLNSRYYDPEIGIFINADSVIAGVNASILSHNMRAYCLNNPINMSDTSGNWPKWVSGTLNAASGAFQMVAGAALGITVGWTGLGAVASGVLMVNGAATATQGIGQVVNSVSNSSVFREDNIIRAGAQSIGGKIGGTTGESAALMMYDGIVFASSIYMPSTATRGVLQQAGILKKRVYITEIVNNPADDFTKGMPLPGKVAEYCRTIPRSGYDAIEVVLLPNGYYQIVNGHHRFAALKSLGHEVVDVIIRH